MKSQFRESYAAPLQGLNCLWDLSQDGASLVLGFSPSSLREVIFISIIQSGFNFISIVESIVLVYSRCDATSRDCWSENIQRGYA